MLYARVVGRAMDLRRQFDLDTEQSQRVVQLQC